MKATLGTRTYNTNSAKLLLSGSNQNLSDPSSYCEDLYRKRTGEYFLYCRGREASKYRKYNQSTGQWVSSEIIMPISLHDAKEWVKDHYGDQKVTELFTVKPGGRRMISAYISSEAKSRLENAASERGVSQASIIESLINDQIDDSLNVSTCN